MTKRPLKTRPELSDADWLADLAADPANAGINVRALFARMFDWCRRNGQTPSRLRLLRWIERERQAVPMAAPASRPSPAPLPPPAAPDCSHCSNERFISIVTDPDAPYAWARTSMVPCPECQPAQYAEVIQTLDHS